MDYVLFRSIRLRMCRFGKRNSIKLKVHILEQARVSTTSRVLMHDERRCLSRKLKWA